MLTACLEYWQFLNKLGNKTRCKYANAALEQSSGFFCLSAHTLGLWHSEGIETMSRKLHRRAPLQLQQTGSVTECCFDTGAGSLIFDCFRRATHLLCFHDKSLDTRWESTAKAGWKQVCQWKKKKFILCRNCACGCQMPVHHLGLFTFLWLIFPDIQKSRAFGH